MSSAFESIGIVGLGLIGGSIALGVRRRWPTLRIVGLDNATVLDAATRLGAIDHGVTELTGLADVHLVILAAPVRQNLRALESIGPCLRSGAVITDTGSTKRQVVDAARALPPHVTFIGGHPLAGAAVGGLEHARATLFAGRPWLFTPEDDRPAAVLERLMGFVTTLGAVPSVMRVEVHDRMLAFLSHLPQLTVSALMSVVGSATREEGLAYAGPGLIDSTRLASSHAAIWQDIVSTNADQVGPALDALIACLQDLRADLGRGDRLNAVFDAANRWRQSLPK
jgi:prephenate dehydrogenase